MGEQSKMRLRLTLEQEREQTIGSGDLEEKMKSGTLTQKDVDAFLDQYPDEDRDRWIDYLKIELGVKTIEDALNWKG